MWRYGELGHNLSKLIKTITNHLYKAYCVKIHRQNGRLQNDMCTALGPTLCLREAAVKATN